MPPNTVLLDTGFAIALENRSDPYHDRAKRHDRRLLGAGTELILHWGIVLEIGDGYARLGRRAKGIALLERFEREAGYRVEPITEALYREAIDLYRSRPDMEWGLTD